MRVRIIGAAPGEVFGTRVVNAETGEELVDVRKISWTHEAGSPPVATVEILMAGMETEAEAEVVKVAP